MSRSILAHLSFNFYPSCQADHYVTFCITHQRDFGPNLPRVSPRNLLRVHNKNKINNNEYPQITMRYTITTWPNFLHWINPKPNLNSKHKVLGEWVMHYYMYIILLYIIWASSVQCWCSSVQCWCWDEGEALKATSSFPQMWWLSPAR